MSCFRTTNLRKSNYRISKFRVSNLRCSSFRVVYLLKFQLSVDCSSFGCPIVQFRNVSVRVVECSIVRNSGYLVTLPLLFTFSELPFKTTFPSYLLKLPFKATCSSYPFTLTFLSYHVKLPFKSYRLKVPS